MLLNATKCQGCSFYVSELLRENQQGGGVVKGKITLPPPRLGLKKTAPFSFNDILDFLCPLEIIPWDFKFPRVL